jgi:phosphoenolpyruvate---glycerone phosphotransferase subunit DhaL
MEYFLNSDGAVVVESVIQTIQENALKLSELDGAIGDGDHGINMNKGVTLTQKEMSGKELDLSGALNTLGRVLLTEIGGAMGPLYGTFFKRMSKSCKGAERIDANAVNNMLKAALAGVQSLGDAKVGDKTLIDTLSPACDAFEEALKNGKTFPEALADLKVAAQKGRDSTKDMVAKIGRASRLGERTRGFLDAGASSCCLILCAMADSMTTLLNPK